MVVVPRSPKQRLLKTFSAFFGSEALLLLGFDREVLPIRSALRRVGVLIRQLEELQPPPGRVGDASVSAAQ